MVDFPQTVAVPSTSAYGPPQVDFSAIANAPNTYYQGIFNSQKRQQNDLVLQQQQRQAQLAQAFPNGLPTDSNGQIDYGKMATTLAKFGDVNGALSVMQQQPAPNSPLLGGAAPQAGQPTPSAPAPSGSVQASPLPPVAAGQPQAAPSGGTVAALAASVGAPSTVAQNVAKAIGVDLAAPLSGPQAAKANSILQSYATRQSGAGLDRLQGAIFGQESSYGSNNKTSVTGARGPMQIQPDTFKQYATAGENIDNPGDNRAVGNRILADYWKRYNGDPARAAVAYFSGPGNVAPPGSPTPWKRDSADPTGKNVSSYVNDVLHKMGVSQLREAMEPANPRVAEGFAQLPPSVNAVSPSASSGNAAGGTVGAAGAPAGTLPPQGAPAPAPQQGPPQQAAQGQPAQQPVQQQPAQQPLVPQVPLPPALRGMDPQQAVTRMREEALRYAQMPNGKAQAAFWNDWADRVEKSIQPVPVRAGETLLDPRSAQPIYSAPRVSNSVTAQLLAQENAERMARGEAPMTAQEEIGFVQSIRPPRSAPAMAVDTFKKDFQAQNGRAPTADEITKFASDYSRQQSYGRAAGTQGARVENAANEVVQLIPQAIEASKTVPRGKWVALNQLVQKYDQGSSDPAYNDFLMANFSLLNAYTRAMNPQGVPRIQERLEQHALGILSTATSQEAYETQVRRLWKEVQASKTATAETAQGVTPGNINAPVPGLDTAGGGSQGSASQKPITKQQYDALPSGATFMAPDGNMRVKP